MKAYFLKQRNPAHNIPQSKSPTINGRKNLKTAPKRNRYHLMHHSPLANRQGKRKREYMSVINQSYQSILTHLTIDVLQEGKDHE